MRTPIDYIRFQCDGCGEIVDIPPEKVRPEGWVEDRNRDYHNVECWWLWLSSVRVLIQGRGSMAFSEAAEEYLR